LKALILCNDFPPINSIGAERPYSWFIYFKENGIEPIVITKNWISNGNSSFNRVSNQNVIEKTNNGILIKTAFRSTPSFLWRKIFNNKLSIVRKALSLLDKILSFVIMYFDNNRGIYLEADKYLAEHDVDIIITTGEPFILFRYGYLLKKKHGIKWIADYRDGWFLNHVTILNKNITSRLLRKYEFYFEKKYIKIVDLITTVDPEMSNRLQKLFSKKSTYIYNGFWKFENEINDNKDNSKLILNHTGTLTSGQRVEFLLECLLDLINNGNIKDDEIEINFIGLEYFPEQLKRVCKNRILKKIIKSTPRLPKNEATNSNLKADFLVNFTDKKLSAIYAKTYNYMACKKQILVIPDDNKILGNLIEENSIGYNFKSKDELKQFLIEKVKLKKDGLLNTNLSENNSLNIFKRSYQTKIFTNIIKSQF
jgi:hypothetical protein